MLANHYIDLARRPIRPADFCGEDVRYSTEFEELEAELAKAESLHTNAGPDWNKVREGSESLLLLHSKDLRAGVWLTWSLYQGQSFAGLQAGIAALFYLCTEHWQDLYPRKLRTRQAAFGWLLLRLEQTVADRAAFSGTEAATIKTLADNIRELDQCLSAHMLDEAPLLLPLCRRLDELASQEKTRSDKPAANSEPAQTEARITPIPRQGADTTAAIGTARDAHKALRSLQEQSRSLCAWWLGESATDARAIRLSRTLLWLPIEALPEHDAQQQTSLRGLPVDRVASYAERMGQGQHAEVLRELEASVAKSPFSLDGQRMVWECLEALGAERAMRELEDQVCLLLARLPGLEQLRFHDGVPFADDHTCAWLAGLTQAPTEKASQELPNPARENTQAPWETALSKAAVTMRKQNLKVAVGLLKQGMQGATSERERFQWQFAQARLCHQGRHYELATHQLESLYQVLQESNLERWEPKLAIRILQLLADSHERLPRKNSSAERRNEIYQRLCHLDLEAVLDQTPVS
ncbi:type VI secretion system protein TssA [Halopseudomonas sp.]|uniref:type VI secretion system protein TssA n=1 Tax=Halopseudomonas sp. TaxID=2901191 RepID=UPI003566CB26